MTLVRDKPRQLDKLLGVPLIDKARISNEVAALSHLLPCELSRESWLAAKRFQD